MALWSQNHFTLIPRSLESMNAGDPRSGRKVWDRPDREIGRPGENREKVIAHRDLRRRSFPRPRESPQPYVPPADRRVTNSFDQELPDAWNSPPG